MLYKEEEFITSNLSTDGILAIDVNCQGIVELTPHQLRFKQGFPNTFDKYMTRCINDELIPGETMWAEEGGYALCLLITCYRATGKDKDDANTIDVYTELALENMFEQARGEPIISGILNRAVDGRWQYITGVIKELCIKYDSNWVVYNK